jgi:hypothetical protein
MASADFCLITLTVSRQGVTMGGASTVRILYGPLCFFAQLWAGAFPPLPGLGKPVAPAGRFTG